MQMTWFCIAYTIWFCQFKPNKLAMLQSFKMDKAEVLIEKATFVINREPEFLFPDGKPRMMKATITFTNGSKIWGVPQGGSQLASETVSLWVSDEAALHDKLKDAFTGNMPSLMGGGKAFILSSIRPSYFADLVDDIKVGKITDEWFTEEKEVLTVVKGVTEWQNRNNNFYVCRIHYSADPNKDPDNAVGRQWMEEEKKKYPDEREWLQEYEIDAAALADSLIYKFNPSIHIIKQSVEDVLQMEGTIYHTLDPGIDDPTAGLWAKVLRSGDIIVFYEYYVRNKAIPEHCIALGELEKYLDIKPVVSRIDPAATKRMFTGTTVKQEYASDSNKPYQRYYIPANNDLEAGIDVVRTYMANAERGISPAVYFTGNLGNLFREMRRYVIGNNDKPKDKNNHALDCLRYLLMSAPCFIDPNARDIFNTYRDELTGYIEYFRLQDEREDQPHGYIIIPD